MTVYPEHQAKREFALLGRLPRDVTGALIGVGDTVWVVETACPIKDRVLDVVIFPLQVIAVDDNNGVIGPGDHRVLGHHCFLDMREAFRETRKIMLAKEGQRQSLADMMLSHLYETPPAEKGKNLDTRG